MSVILSPSMASTVKAPPKPLILICMPARKPAQPPARTRYDACTSIGPLASTFSGATTLTSVETAAGPVGTTVPGACPAGTSGALRIMTEPMPQPGKEST